MNFETLKQRLSLKKIGQSLQRVVMRFPVTVCFLVLLTGILSYYIHNEYGELSRIVECVIFFLCCGIFISLATTLWGEEQHDKRKRWIAESVSLLLFAVYSVLLFLTDIIPNTDLPAFYIGNAAWAVAILIFIPFGSFLKENNDLKVWHFLLSLCLALLFSGIVSLVMLGGLEGLLYGTAALFDSSVNQSLPILIMIACIVLLFGLLFLALIPQAERKHNASADMPSFLNKVVSWLLLPLLGCYIAVLYVYGINILIHWELPKGMISGLVSAVMVGYVLCYILLYPQVTDKNSWQSKVLTRWLPIIILPLLVLMTVGVVRRFMDYGITAPRLYLLTILLWFYAICIVMLVVPRKRFRWIAFSFVALFVLSSGHPLNYYRICRPILTAKIDKTIAEKGRKVPFDRECILYHCTEEYSLQKLYQDIKYMEDNYGKEYAGRWVKDYSTEPSDLSEPEEYYEKWSITYHKKGSYYTSPQGYSSFMWVHKTYNDKIDVPMDSLYNGILHVRYKDDVLLFDTATIRQANETVQLLLIHSDKGNVALSTNEIDITPRNKQMISVGYCGYMFYKSNTINQNHK